MAGVDKLMRDPCIIRGGDGRFHMAWTVSWNEQGIGYASSEDLINWTEQLYIPVMHHESEAKNCWAPELFYDDERDRYMIFWATTIPGRFPETDSFGDQSSDYRYNHRMYYTTTEDFHSFAGTELLYDPGFNVIDATIRESEGEYIMFLKNETRWPVPEKNIRIATSHDLYSGWSPASDPITDDWVEGPTALQTVEGWTVYFDRYRKHEMGAVFSADLENWMDISGKLHFPEGTKHGSVFRVKRSELEKLKQAFPDRSGPGSPETGM
jgi:hypothetical protein